MPLGVRAMTGIVSGFQTGTSWGHPEGLSWREAEPCRKGGCLVSSGDPRISPATVPAWLSPQPFLVGTDRYMRADSWHPGSTKAGRLQGGVEDLLMEENPVWAIAQADHAATAEHTSGQPYSAAEVKPCCCPSQAGRGCREETDPLFTVGKTKGFPLPWDIIQFPQTLVLRAHFPSLPLCSCSRTFVAQLRCPELRGAQCLPLLLSVPAGTGLHSTVGMGLSAGPQQWKSCPCWPGSPGEYSTSRGCPLGAGLCLTTACAQALMDLCV